MGRWRKSRVLELPERHSTERVELRGALPGGGHDGQPAGSDGRWRGCISWPSRCTWRPRSRRFWPWGRRLQVN